jgi:hypothetical protein
LSATPKGGTDCARDLGGERPRGAARYASSVTLLNRAAEIHVDLLEPILRLFSPERRTARQIRVSHLQTGTVIKDTADLGGNSRLPPSNQSGDRERFW